ncbi:MAG: hypothetical protein ACD_79C00650G0008 [uncultured bacterium]|nr:MAG: hypothetical protein ACD_79C00650G0008 [uncultured bacterium]
MTNLPTLKIGNFKITPPIIQGGMGVRVSGANLAAAVANEGCVGVIAGVGLGKFENAPGSQFIKLNNDALREEIRKARKLSNGIIGVNLMVVLSNYTDLVQIAVEENIDMIISGSGLPLDLPKLVGDKDIKLVPIVSSARSLRVICQKWKKNYNKIPDAVIVEGPLAGGHLGYSADELVSNNPPLLENIVTEVVEFVKSGELNIPVIAAGGIFDGKDIVKFLKLGASGVQLGTRFVCTEECDVHEAFKKAYIDAKNIDDTTIIKSPVGLPGRVIKNAFVDKINKGETIPFKCNYRCLRTCDPKVAPYCIAKVLTNASNGLMDQAFAFSGINSYRCDKIVTVKELVSQLSREIKENL